jgi:hypothetical protein
MTAVRPLIVTATVALLAGWMTPHARALINPNFTPADLVKGSTTIVELELRRDGQGGVTAHNLKALKGDAPKDVLVQVDDSIAEVFPVGTDSKGQALLFLADLAGAGEATEAVPPVGALHVGNGWLGLYVRSGGGYTLSADKRDLKTVWAGATSTLAMALRYVLADPARATFPVAVGAKWRGETAVAKRGQPVAGLQSVELVAGTPPVLHILSPAGDRLFVLQDAAAKEAAVRGLTAKSERACWTDLDGDGRWDLVSWDGKTVGAWLQDEVGNLVGKEGLVELPSVTTLVALRGGAAAGADGRVVVLGLKDKGLEIVQTLTVPEAQRASLTLAGPVGAADFDADGATDLMQAYDHGLVAWPGTADGTFGAGRAVHSGRVGKNVAAMEAGDFDSDGLLDILVAGRLGEGDGAGANLLANAGGWVFTPAWNHAGEVYKVQPRARSVQVCDINTDGKFDFMLAYERGTPVFLFNRGFRTFGTGDELTLAGAMVGEGDAAKPFASADAFNNGAPFGAVADFDGDGAQDGAFATADGDVWVVWRDRGSSGQGLSVAVAPGAGPVRVTLTEGQTALGAVLAVPGRPAYCGFPSKGGVKLAWNGADGKPRTKTVPVIKPLTRVELGD